MSTRCQQIVIQEFELDKIRSAAGGTDKQVSLRLDSGRVTTVALRHKHQGEGIVNREEVAEQNAPISAERFGSPVEGTIIPSSLLRAPRNVAGWADRAVMSVMASSAQLSKNGQLERRPRRGSVDAEGGLG
jgi:hypothetical protein